MYPSHAVQNYLYFLEDNFLLTRLMSLGQEFSFSSHTGADTIESVPFKQLTLCQKNFLLFFFKVLKSA